MSLIEVIVLLIVLCFIVFSLVLLLNRLTLELRIVKILFVVIYPYLKRIYLSVSIMVKYLICVEYTYSSCCSTKESL